MRTYLLAICLCLALTACDKNETSEPSAQKEHVTGFTIIDPNGNPVQDIGTPNEKNFTGAGLAARFYPNPASDFLEVRLAATPTATVTAWLTFARLDQSLQNSIYYSAPAGTPGETALEIIKNKQISGNESIQVDISELPEGPYRLYFRSGTETAWKNVIIKR